MSAPLTHPSPHHSRRARAVEAVCVHWTGGSFAGALDWCQRAESKVSYHEIIGPAGERATLVPWNRAAWSVGASRAPVGFTFGTFGNSATDNIALAGAPPRPVTDAQRATLAVAIADRFRARKWGIADLWRIVGHADLSPGRKRDPWGNAWLSRDAVVADVRAILEAAP